ncbi:MAG: hypothetical protein Q7T50_08390, partial [Candidatus Magasanikbacteria bacterium]|nr:hypothetical protein [Candidatus Magasanikbacteria bacterium]
MPTKNYSKLFFLIFFSLGFLFSSQVSAAEPIDDLDYGIWHFDEENSANALDYGFYNHDLIWMCNPWGLGKVYPDRVPGKWDMGI